MTQLQTQVEAQIVSLNVGMPKPASYRNKEIMTGIYKQPIDGPVWLSNVNFAGDAQGDLINHGGKEKAVCVYACEHYDYWEKELGKPLSFGAFGENLTTRGLLETDVYIGDQFKLGEAILEVSQPRQPCYKLAMKHEQPDLPQLVQQTGYTGYYCRVLQEGYVSSQDRLTLYKRGPGGITIADTNRIMHHDKHNEAAIRALLALEALSVNWRKTLSGRLAGTEADPSIRLHGPKS